MFRLENWSFDQRTENPEKRPKEVVSSFTFSTSFWPFLQHSLRLSYTSPYFPLQGESLSIVEVGSGDSPRKFLRNRLNVHFPVSRDYGVSTDSFGVPEYAFSRDMGTFNYPHTDESSLY